jgi:AcrR family transcriptional regulator
MTPPTSTPPAERLLATAALLFAGEGIRAVGIDRLINEAGVARASLYQAFGSKDQLIAEYLRRQHDTDRRNWLAATRGADGPIGKVMGFFESATKAAKRRQYVGCLYLNAAAEFPDRAHPVWEAVHEHRTWMREEVTRLLTEAGVPDAAGVAASVQLLYDGGLAGSKFERSAEPITRAADLARALIEGKQGRVAPA